MRRLRVLLVDDHPLFREGLARVLGECRDIEIVGVAADAAGAVRLVEVLSPDVVLMDIALPGVNGIEATRAIRRRDPRVAVIILTVHDDDEHLFGAIRVGAAAFSGKGIGREELARMVRRVGRGEYLVNESLASRPVVASRVLRQFRDMAKGAPPELYESALLAPLTGRETEILDGIVRGLSNREIARALSISDQTVKNHISSILRKLAVNDRTQAVLYALRRGWIRMPPEPAQGGEA